LEHTIFALPFAYMALLLACRKQLPPPRLWILITLAMVGGRTAGMALNRIIDQEIDARNPRTAGREIPSGQVTVGQAWGLAGFGVLTLLWAAWRLHPICAWLAPILVILLTVYPYAKRWTWAAHGFLGLIYFCIPPAVWLAAVQVISWTAVFLGLAMGTWVTGFDILYSLQDWEFDKSQGLQSIPVRFGPVVALGISAALHLQTLVWLGGVGWILGLGWAYWIGILVTGAFLWHEHRLVAPDDLSRLNQAFFTVNGFISVWLLFVVWVSLRF